LTYGANITNFKTSENQHQKATNVFLKPINLHTNIIICCFVTRNYCLVQRNIFNHESKKAQKTPRFPHYGRPHQLQTGTRPVGT